MIIKKIFTSILSVFILYGCSKKEDINNIIDNNFNIAELQYSKMLNKIGKSVNNPRTIAENGNLKLVPAKDWTSGFFPGGLWYIYEATKDDKWLKAAQFFTENVEKEQFNAGTHDMGFKIFCSYGNGYRLTNKEEYGPVLINSAKTLITRFNRVIGCIRSWDHNKDKWDYPVIIDNMINLELLFWATKESGDSVFYNIALQHALTTLKNHFRADNSSWHVVNYDTLTGGIISKNTHQGTSDESSWARGQAWGLYGFTMTYRETGKKIFLEQAVKIADFILSHPNLPRDFVPYWDFDAQNIPDAPRDASAASIICSALYELQKYVPKKKDNYRKAADTILETLSSNKYLAMVGENKNFLLEHSVGHYPKNHEINVPIIYADYYFLEANLRRKMVLDGGN